MLIRVLLQTGEPVALTDEPPVFRLLEGQMAVLGVIQEGDGAFGSWPDRAWLLALGAAELAGLRARAKAGSEVREQELRSQAPFLDMRDLRRAADRFCGRPWKIAETERLLMREFCPDDAAALLQIYQDSQIRKYVEPLPDSEEEVRALLASYIRSVYEVTGIGSWAVTEKNSGRLIGRAGFEPDGDGLALGYLLAGSARGAGYAEEACRALLAVAREEFEITAEKIRCYIAPDNIASRKLAEKLGLEIVTVSEIHSA